MLVDANSLERCYVIALNNASDGAEIMADFSYLENAPPGVITFDFTHMAAPLTQETREAYLPGNYGYQPTRQLVEVVSAIGHCAATWEAYPHYLEAVLPDQNSRVGNFLCSMRLPVVLKEMGLDIVFANLVSVELGDDDASRQNLVPLTRIDFAESGCPDFGMLQRIRERVEGVFTQALPDDLDLASCFTSVVNEAVDNLLEYGQGGLLGGLYYPRAGEVEISLINRCGGFGGSTPSEELETLVQACEGGSRRENAGGNGISELSRLSIMCFGTLVVRNGSATLHLLPDGSVVATTDATGLSTLGASVTILLQLLPARTMGRTMTLEAFESVLLHSLANYYS